MTIIDRDDHKGFTLIELLVVISIIGLLASIVMVAMNTSRAKARDARRVGDIKQFITALELYYDANSGYPVEACGGTWAGNYPGYESCWTDLTTRLAPYMSRLPLDPLDKYPPTQYTYPYWYRTMNSGAGYYLLMWPEGNIASGDQGCYDPLGTGWHCLGINWQ